MAAQIVFSGLAVTCLVGAGFIGALGWKSRSPAGHVDPTILCVSGVYLCAGLVCLVAGVVA